MSRQRIVIAGGTGFIGRALTAEFLARQYSVVILTRSPSTRAGNDCQELGWDGRNPGGWTAALDGAAAIINLTGKNINCPHTAENLRELTASRVDSVHAIATALGQIQRPPAVWVQAGATGFYGDTGDRSGDENSPAGTGALAKICTAWEKSFQLAAAPATRKVVLRIGFVLGRDGGALPVLSRLTKLFLGGAAGSGRQYISWIYLADLVAMFVAAVEQASLAGTFNAVAPGPVTNAEFMRALRHALHRPWSPPAPEFAVRLGARLLRSEAALALMSCRTLPRRFAESGFPYRFAGLAAALDELTSPTPALAITPPTESL